MGEDLRTGRAEYEAMWTKHADDPAALWDAIGWSIVGRLEFNARVDKPVLEAMTAGQVAVGLTWNLYSMVRSRSIVDYAFYHGSNLPWAIAGLRTLGADEQLHFVEGFFRDQFDGATPQVWEDWEKVLKKKGAKKKLLERNDEASAAFREQRGFARHLRDVAFAYAKEHPEQLRK